MNVSINKYNEEQISQLRNMQTKNPKYYWKFINQIRDSPSTNLSPSIESLFNHFQKESNKETHNEKLNIQVDIELNLENETNTLNKKNHCR